MGSINLVGAAFEMKSTTIPVLFNGQIFNMLVLGTEHGIAPSKIRHKIAPPYLLCL